MIPILPGEAWRRLPAGGGRHSAHPAQRALKSPPDEKVKTNSGDFPSIKMLTTVKTVMTHSNLINNFGFLSRAVFYGFMAIQCLRNGQK